MLFNILMTVDEYVTYKHGIDVLNDIIFIIIIVIAIVLYFMGKDR